MLFGEAAQHIDGIVADGKNRDVLAREVGQAALQLDELRFAEGSPAGAAMEHHQGAATGAGLVQIDALAMLVRYNDVGEAFPNGRADLVEVDPKIRDSGHTFSFSLCVGWSLNRDRWPVAFFGSPSRKGV
jgi:hypothetical protein